MHIDSETLNVVFVIVQTLVIIVGTIFTIRRWMTEPLREAISSTSKQLRELKDETDQKFESVNNDIKRIEGRLHSLEVELPKNYIRQDQFLAFHNKTEAMLYRKLDDITTDLRNIQKLLMEGKHERRSN